MKRIALVLALTAGCTAIENHPYAATAIDAVAGAGAVTCAVECPPLESGMSLGALVTAEPVIAAFLVVVILADQWSRDR